MLDQDQKCNNHVGISNMTVSLRWSFSNILSIFLIVYKNIFSCPYLNSSGNLGLLNYKLHAPKMLVLIPFWYMLYLILKGKFNILSSSTDKWISIFQHISSFTRNFLKQYTAVSCLHTQFPYCRSYLPNEVQTPALQDPSLLHAMAAVSKAQHQHPSWRFLSFPTALASNRPCC